MIFYGGFVDQILNISGFNADQFYLVFISATVLSFYIISVLYIDKRKSEQYPDFIKAFLFIAFTIGVLYLNHTTKDLSVPAFYLFDINSQLFEWFRKCFINFQKVAALSLPLLLPYYLQKQKLGSFYGFTREGFDPKPYLIMLIIMAPLVFMASFGESFQAKYPRYVPGYAEESGLISNWFSVGAFEITYLLRFIGVEIFFRGFLILGGVLIFGRKAILPAACLYSAWHFGKPMGEAIGALFGGYILGIISYRSGSILGGIAVHYGIALLMEVFAWAVILGM